MRALADNRQNEPDQLDARIARAKAAAGGKGAARQVSAENRGWAVGIEFVGVVLVSTAIGWGIDNYAGLGTRPWAMIVMLVLGFAAGVRRALQTSSQFDSDPDTDDAK